MSMSLTSPSGTLTNSLLGAAGGMVAYAQGRVAAVDSYILNLSNSVLSLQAPSITPEFPTGGSTPVLATDAPPTFDTVVWAAPGFPTAFTEILEVDDLGVEPFDDDPPLIVYGTAPTPFTGTLPDAPAVNLTFDDPTLTVTLPAPPNLLSISVMPFQGMNLPTFDEDAPELTAVEPSIREYVPGSQYTSALLSGLQTTLLDRITNGGTGLTPEVENAIWDRGREREFRTQAEALAQLDQMEELGFSLPPGSYVDARLKIITETDAANRGVSREIMIQSSQLMLDNVKHALTTATALESRLMDYTNSVEQRIFESTRYATEAGVQIYNAKVQAYAAMTDVYRAKVQVYQAQIQAETAKVEAYRAQIAAEEAKAQINTALVAQYKVQVDAALSNIEIYKAELAGIQTKAEIERTKVQVFGAQVQGFTAQVNAYTAGVEGYRATLQAEATKAQVYTSQVQAFSARVDANAKVLEARIESYKARIAAKGAEFDGYRAAVAGESARVDAIAKGNAVKADAFKSVIQATGAYNEVLVKQWQAILDQNQRTAEAAISAAKANAELYVSTRSLALDAAKTGAQVAAQIGAAALNAVNYSGSVSSSEGTSQSANFSQSTSQSTSSASSSSTNTNYNYSV